MFEKLTGEYAGAVLQALVKSTVLEAEKKIDYSACEETIEQLLFNSFIDFIGYAEQEDGPGKKIAKGLKWLLAFRGSYKPSGEINYFYSPSGELQRATWKYKRKKFSREYDPGNGRKLYAAMMKYKTDPAAMPAFGY